MVYKTSQRPEEPILNVDEKEDIKAFYHNLAYKVNRHAINLQKIELLKDRLSECVRTEGVNYKTNCEQALKRYQAAVRVFQYYNAGKFTKGRNVGDLMNQRAAIAAEAPAA